MVRSRSTNIVWNWYANTLAPTGITHVSLVVLEFPIPYRLRRLFANPSNC